MPTASAATAGTVVVLDDVPGGIALVPPPLATPLTRLNFYDGRFLRGEDLTREQQAMRAYVELSNQAGGPGVAHGLDVSLEAGPVLRLSGGMAIDPRGRVLLLPDAALPELATLLEAAKGAAAPAPAGPAGSPAFAPCEIATTVGTVVSPVAGVELYLVAGAQVEGLCGDAEIFGRLCDDACVTPGDRPYRIDGVALLLLPLQLSSPLPSSTTVPLTDTHLRSQVASAYFADERRAGGSLLSAAGLKTNVWCRGATGLAGDLVPLGILGLRNGSVVFLDEWSARRERMEPPNRRYWAGRMELRPWPTFLAQVLQFQCQLGGILLAPTPPGSDDGCGEEQLLLEESTKLIEELSARLAEIGDDGPGGDVVTAWKEKLQTTLSAKRASGEALHILVDGGIVEVPAAGYLPVDPNAGQLLRDQVQDLLGAGVDLRLCAVRRDQIAHELERAQHMDRISLLAGLDDPADRQEVDILVPDGLVRTATTTGTGFDVEVALGYQEQEAEEHTEVAADGSNTVLRRFNMAAMEDPRRVPLQGAARLEAGSGVVLRTALAGPADRTVRRMLRLLATLDEAGDYRGFKSARFTSHPMTDAQRRAVADAVHREVAGRRRSGRSRISMVSGIDEDLNLLGVWATLTLGADPFELPVGATTTATVTVQAVLPGEKPTVLDVTLDADLRVRRTRGDLLAREVRVELTLNRSDASANLGGAGRPRGSGATSLLLIRRRRIGGGRIEVRAPGGADAVTLTWGGEPTVAQVAFGRSHEGMREEADVAARGTLVGGGSTGYQQIGTRIATALALEDPALSEPGNVHHDAAVAGLSVVQAANADDPRFLDVALEQLFPPSAESSVTVEPTTDWVLFRRRRREVCGGGAVAAPPGRVAAWVATAGNEEDAKAYAEQLRSGGGSDVPFRPMGTLDYAPGGADLLTSSASVQARYQSADGGPTIVFAGYAVNGQAPSGAARAGSVVEALEGVAELEGDVDVVVDPPAGTLATGTEGSVYLITLQEDADPPHACVEVYFVHVDKAGNGAPDVVKALQNGDVHTLESFPGVLEELDEVPVGDGGPDGETIAALAQKIQDLYGDNTELWPWVRSTLTGSEQDAAVEDLKAVTELLHDGLEELGVPVLVNDVDQARLDEGCGRRVLASRQVSDA